MRRARKRRAAGEEPLEFIPEFPPTGQAMDRALSEDELDALTMPTFDGIGHDAAWRRFVRTTVPAHAAVLAGAMDRF